MKFIFPAIDGANWRFLHQLTSSEKAYSMKKHPKSIHYRTFFVVALEKNDKVIK